MMSERQLGDSAIALVHPIPSDEVPTDAYEHLYSRKPVREPRQPVDSAFNQPPASSAFSGTPELLPSGRAGFITVKGMPANTPAMEFIDGTGKKFYKYRDAAGNLVDVPTPPPEVEDAEDDLSIKFSISEGGMFVNMGTVDGERLRDPKTQKQMMAGYLVHAAQQLDPGLAPVYAVTAVQQYTGTAAPTGAALDSRTPIALGARENTPEGDSGNPYDAEDNTDTSTTHESLGKRALDGYRAMRGQSKNMSDKYKAMDDKKKDRLKKLRKGVVACWLISDVIFIGGNTAIDVAEHKAVSVVDKMPFVNFGQPSQHDKYAIRFDKQHTLGNIGKLAGGPILMIENIPGL
jgi:hypothetical protein